jgi:peptidoglycan hydrolase-like protein with peptidoglycan-binding domain
VIYSYNAAESYTLAIAILAQRLAGGSGIETPWPTDDPGLSRAERREMQRLLTKRGYDVGEPDGAIGAKTKAAIADFEGKNGLGVDGRASVKVLAALRR